MKQEERQFENDRRNVYQQVKNSYSSAKKDFVKETSYFNIDVIDALKDISTIAFPTMFFFMGVYMQQTINLIFIGHSYEKHLQQDALDAVGISHLYINCTLLSIVVGLISGFDTLGSNSYGTKNYYLFGVYFHRAILIALSVTSVLFIFHFIFAVKIIGLLGLEENVLILVSKYMHIMMFWVLPDLFYTAMFRYLNIVGKSAVNMKILIISLAIHPLWCYLFIIKLGWGVQGAGLSLVLTHILNALLTAYYIVNYSPVPESIFPVNEDSFKGWWDYLKVALPSVFLSCAEWLAFEITAIIAIWIGKLDYTVHILISNLSLNLFTLSFGFAITSCVIVGNNILTKPVEYIKKYTMLVYAFGLSLMIISLAFIYFYRNSILLIFTLDSDIIDKGKYVIPLLCLYKISDLIGGISGGVFRGLGKQMIASKISFVNFYITQITFSIFFGKYLGWGIYGLWVGLCIGSGLNAFCFVYVLINFDYEEIKKEISFRLEYDKMLLQTGETDKIKLNRFSRTNSTVLYEKEMNEVVSDKYFI